VAAVAETGSVVLVGGPGRPLLASLLPETHLVVVRPDQFVSTLTEALQLDALQEAANSILVSGPSRTGDIELTLTVGVHGPKRLIVFCLLDDAD
jgi:L-lactate dehydrogenase complex protein LldG